MNETEGKRKALIIAVSEYENKNLPYLEFCKNDGQKMYELLKRLDYNIPENFKLIGNVKYDIMRQAIISFFRDKNTKPKDTLVFYYSGHGVPDGQGNTYLSTSEIDASDPYPNGYPFADVTFLMSSSISKRVITILDCCYSGSLKLDNAAFTTEEVKKSAEQAIAKKANESIIDTIKKGSHQGLVGEGKCIMASSQAHQESVMLKRLGHSLFTYYLLEGLEGAHGRAVDNEGNVTPSILGEYVFEQIMNLAPEKRPNQTPILKTENAGKIILAKYPEFSKSTVNDGSLVSEGLTHFVNGDNESALKLFDQAIQINPKNFVAYNYKGDIFFKLQKYEESIKWYDKALEINPKYVDVLKDKGLSLEKLGKYEQALNYFEKTLEINPKVLKNWYYKGSILIKLKKYEQALNCFDKVLESNPLDTESLYYKGLILESLKKYNNALDCYKKVISIDPYNIGTQSRIDSLSSEIHHTANDINSLNTEGLTLYNQGKYQEAIIWFEKALKIDPDNVSLLYNRFLALQKVRKADVSYDIDVLLSKLPKLPQLSSVHWDNLLSSINNKKCIPCLGDSALEFFHQVNGNSFLTHKEISIELAKNYNYPLEDFYRLPKVAQFLAIREGRNMFPKELVCNKLRRMSHPNFSLDKFKNSPHLILAQLNLPIYITTNYDLLLEEALRSQGKEPFSEVCRWNDEIIQANENELIPSVFERKYRQYRPTPSNPLVYHVFGSIEYPLSMVLTERDYSDFIIYLNRESEQDTLPPFLRQALVGSSLLFIGYRFDIDNLDFRTIFQGVLSFMSSVPRNRDSISILQVPTMENDNKKNNEKLEYFEKYIYNMFNIIVYWEYPGQFIQELPIKWEKFIDMISR